MLNRAILLSTVLTIGCGSQAADDPGEPDVPDSCSLLFAQDVVPEYHVDITAAEWAKLEDEFLHRPERVAAGLDPHPYHPIDFRMKEGSRMGPLVPGVEIRLKGSSSWLQAIALDADPKMQFVIAFNDIDPKGRFMGVRKVELDMPRTDHTFLKQRFALYYLRAAGISAQCANSARLYINGTYYGLYTNLERPDKEYLQRIFPGADDGDLWKGGRTIQTNEDTFTWDRLDSFWQVKSVDQLDALVDLDTSVREWAAEAMIGDADGYYNGRPNYWLYDHPTNGFTWLPADLDTALDTDFLPTNASPVSPKCSDRDPDDRIHYLLVMNDPAWFDRYLVDLKAARAAYHRTTLEDRLDTWSAQIASAAAEDPHKPFSNADHDYAVAIMRNYVGARAEFIDSWLDCREHGGDDADGDGVAFCNECDDHDAQVHPGAAEACNGVDDDCDGLVDEGCQ